jgi:hypothetical protein
LRARREEVEAGMEVAVGVRMSGSPVEGGGVALLVLSFSVPLSAGVVVESVEVGA